MAPDSRDTDKLANEIDRTIDVLVEHIDHVAGRAATISRRGIDGTVIQTVWVEPLNPRAREIDIIGEQFLIVQIGTIGGRWELGYESTDVDFAKELIDAAVAGRIVETVGVECSRVEVAFADGSRHHESGFTARAARPLLWPFTRRRPKQGPEVRYEPYGT